MAFRRNRSGQVSIEYVAGFLFFTFSVLFIVANVIDKMPQYYDESHNTILHETAWLASERIMSYASFGGVLNASALNRLAECTQYPLLYPYSEEYNNSKSNYTYFKFLFGLGKGSEFRMKFLEFAFLIPNASSGTNYTGEFTIDGATRAFEIYNSTPQVYDGVHIGAYYASVGEKIKILSNNYTVEDINNKGRFAVISRTLVDCGRNVLQGKTSARVRRYAVYNGSVARMELVVWR